MKPYTKPTIEFIELRPEERLACNTGRTGSGCCGTDKNSQQSYAFWIACPKKYPDKFGCGSRKKSNSIFCWW